MRVKERIEQKCEPSGGHQVLDWENAAVGYQCQLYPIGVTTGISTLAILKHCDQPNDTCHSFLASKYMRKAGSFIQGEHFTC